MNRREFILLSLGTATYGYQAVKSRDQVDRDSNTDYKPRDNADKIKIDVEIQ